MKLMRTAGFLLAGAVLLGGSAGCGTVAAEQKAIQMEQNEAEAEQESVNSTQEITETDRKEQTDSEIVNFAFELTDFNLLGYDVFADHFEDICAAVDCPVQELTPRMQSMDSVFGKAWAYTSPDSGRNPKRFQFMPKEEYFLEWTTDFYGNEIRCYRNSLFTEKESTGEMSAHLDISTVSDSPVTLGDSYDEWLQLIGLEDIRKRGVQIKDGEVEEHSGDIVDEYRFRTKWGNAVYSEWQTRFKEGDDALYCWLNIYLAGEEGDSASEESEEDCFAIGVIFDSNQKVGSWNARLEYGDE